MPTRLIPPPVLPGSDADLTTGAATVAPISRGQKALWWTDRLAPESGAYVIAAAARVVGGLDPAALEAAVQALVDRHPSLRATFEAVDGEPVQRVAERMDAPVRRLDARGWSDDTLERRVAEEAYRPFDLERGPLVRFVFFERGPAEDPLLVLSIHHLISDLWSLSVLLRELGELYGAAPDLPPLETTYRQMVEREEARLVGGEGERLLEFWIDELAGRAAALALPTDRRRPATRSQRGGAERFRLDAAAWKRLRKVGRAHKANPFVTVLAGLQALLHRLSGQDDVIVGTPTAGRRSGDVSDVVGYCVNPVAVRADASGDPAFSELLERVRAAALRSFDHQDLPFPVVVERLEPERDASRPPIFQVIFTLQRSRLGVGEGMSGFALGEGGARLELGPLTFESLDLEPVGAQFDLSVLAAEVGGELWGTLVYDRDLFDRATARRMADQLVRLLDQVARDPSVRLSEIELLDAADRHELLREWGAPASPPGTPRRLDARVRAQAARTPDATALVAGDERWTYGRLTERAARLAAHLRQLGVGRETRVGVCLERRSELVIGLLAVLEAGAAYVPLDPAYPEDRLAFMLEDAGAPVVLATEATRGSLPADLDARVVDPLEAADPAAPGGAPRDESEVDDLAYVIYTSGSTGRPKGVAITHRSASALVDWGIETFSEDELSGLLAGTSVSFDLSVFELFVTLSAGGRVILETNALGVAAHQGSDAVRLLNTVPSAMRELVAAGALPDSVVTVNLAGEPLQRRLVDDIYRTFPGVRRVLNLYGPSEDTTYSTGTPVPRDETTEPTIGRPLAGSHALVLDRQGVLVPPGVVGELCLAGDSLARGYLGRPAETARRFVPDPHGERPGGRLYRTGDLARWRTDGELEYLGRLDHQVKLRGFRIELQEIEAVLTSSPEVEAAAVAVREQGEHQFLAGYVVPTGGVGRGDGGAQGLEARLQAHVGEHLPAYMVPATVVVLDELPLTPNGKVDRKALPEPRLSAGDGLSVEPGTATERRLAELFVDTLGLPEDHPLGLEDDFFRLGGHSLLATRLVTRVRDRLGVDLPVSAIFETPTVAGLARRLDAAPVAAIEPRPDPERAPLSFAQERLWFLAEVEPDSASYNMPGAVHLTGRLDLAALAAALGRIVDRHEPLRTELVDTVRGPEQRIAPPGAVRLALPTIDLAGLARRRAEAEAERLTVAEARRPMAFDVAPLLRVRLVRLAADEHRLALTFHHVISDGWSLGVFVHELGALYRAAVDGGPAALGTPPISYGDFALWQRERLTEQAVQVATDWWRRELAGTPPVIDLPTDRPRPPRADDAGRTLRLPLPDGLAAALAARGRERGATLFMMLLAGFEVLLARLAGHDDLVLGTVDAGRGRSELEGLLGFFVDTLPVRARLAGDPTLAEVVDRTRRSALGAFAHQELPFDRLVHELDVERVPGASPLVQVLVALQNTPLGALELPGLDVAHLPVDNRTAKFDLTLSFEPVAGDVADGLVGAWNFRRALFDPTTVRRMARQLETIYRAMVASPGTRLSELSATPPAERHQLLVEWSRSATAPPLGARTLDGLFRAQARRTPKAVAVDAGDVRLTYAELAARVRSLAGALGRAGVGPESRVGVYLPRTADLVVALLAVHEAGGAYVALDPRYPADRLAFVLEDSGIEVVVADDTSRASLPASADDGAWRVIAPDAGAELVDDGHRLAADDDGDRLCDDDGDRLAYVLYTSGSTGRPKGVAIPHAAAARLLDWGARLHGPDELSGLVAATSVAFDLSVFELFLPLATGGRVVLVADMMAAPDELAERGARVINTVPSVLQEVLAAGGLPASVTTVNLAGEPLRRALVDDLHETSPGVEKVYNLYGPSEDTTYSTGTLVPRDETAEPSVGRPVASSEALILNRALGPLPVGVVGELYLGGGGLARGYVGRSALTAERFVPDPRGTTPGGRIYRTGDLARWRRDGEIEVTGRIDHQVKLRGFRIELGEIEAVLAAHPRVTGAVAAVLGEGAQKHLAATVSVAEPPASDDLVAAFEEELGHHLADLVPPYMVPVAWSVVGELPRTPNGKVDRQALPRPARRLATAELPPRDALERTLAELFARVLELPPTTPLDIETSFFQLGGHSLLVGQLTKEVHRRLGVQLSVREVFEAPTVASLARRLRAVAPPEIPRRDDRRHAPLTSAQERLWFLYQMEPEAPVYNMPGAVRMVGRLDAGALAGAVRDLIDRQEALRTELVQGIEEPIQRIRPSHKVPVELPMVDLSALDDPAAEVRRLGAAEASRALSPGRAPLLRMRLLRLGPEEHVLTVVLHHVVSDGWSLGVFIHELATFYRARVTGGEPALEPLAISYGDFAAWQRDQRTDEVLAEHMDWWRDELAGAPTSLGMPTDRPRPRRGAGRGRQGRVLRLPLPQDLVDHLAARGRDLDATLFMVLLAGFGALLGRWSDRDDLLVGTVDAGRTRGELDSLIGLFVETLPIRVRLGRRARASRLVGRIRQAALGSLVHRETPFHDLVREIAPQATAGEPPLVQVVFSFQNMPPEPLALPGLELDGIPLTSGTSKFDLDLNFEPAEGGDGLVGVWTYDHALYDTTTVRRLADQLERLYRVMVESPDAPLLEAPWLSAAERHQTTVEWSRAAADTPLQDEPFHELIWRHARRDPDAPAVVAADRRLSFGELHRLSLALAVELRRQGVGPETLVGLAVDRGSRQVVGALGILAAGGAYVPLDPTQPRQRLETIAREADLRLVVTERASLDRLGETGATRVLVDDLDPSGIDETSTLSASLADRPPISRDRAAYVIFTSGSTGTPKGVVGLHGPTADRLRWIEDGEPGGRGRGLAKASIGFDLSVAELFGPLVAGQAVVIVAPGGQGDLPGVLELARREDVAQMWLLPSQLSVLLEQLGDAERIDFLDGVHTGAEAVPPTLAARFGERFASVLINNYGPTETTVSVTAQPLDTGAEATRAPIGRPTAGAHVHLLDARLEPVPPGVPGEIVVGGVPVTRGYLHRPAQTAERFVPSPFGVGQRLYRSGDLARRWGDGTLEFLGRIDRQVKVRGFRIELGEIEATLARHPAVLEAAVLDFEDPASENRRLAAFVVLDPERPTDSAELQAFTARRLPAYMVPTAIEQLATLPLGGSGKIDRARLPEPRWSRVDGATAEPPQGPVEARLADLFADLLEIEGVGRHDDFFDLGGHSLLASRLLSRVRTAFGLELRLASFFDRPTVAGLARVLEASGPADDRPEATDEAPIERRADPALAPVTFSQERLWFIDQLAPDSAAYNIPAAVRLAGPLDVGALAGALADVVARHEPLRTELFDASGTPMQRILEADRVELALPVVDLSGLPAGRRAGHTRDRLRREALRPLPLGRAPLVRCLLVATGRDEHLLSVVFHHAIADGWSMGVFVRDLARFYHDRHAGRPRNLQPPPVTYGDFALWQRDRISEDVLAGEIEWWHDQLDGAPTVVDLPFDRPRPRQADPAGGTLHQTLGTRLVEQLEARAFEQGATLFMVLLAGFEILLARLARREDLLVGTVDAGRPRAELEDLVGFFVETLVLRARFDGGPTLGEAVRRTRRATLGALAHRALPFDRLVRELVPDRKDSAPPLIQALLAFQNTPQTKLELAGLELEPVPVSTDTAKFDLSVSLQPVSGPGGQRLSATWSFSRALFDTTTVQRISRQLETVYRAIAERPELPWNELSLLGASERHQLLVEWNDEPWPVDPDGACLHDVIWERAGRTPDALAVVADDGRLTYAELRSRAFALAVDLRRRGVGPESRVGLYTERTLDQVVGALGVMTAGAAYVPLDPAFPRRRLEAIVDQGRLELVATHERLAASVGALGVTPVWIDRLTAPDAGGVGGVGGVRDVDRLAAELARGPAASPDNAVYVLFTSGSTGRPKGVVACHRSVTNRLAWAALHDPVGQGPGLLKASIGFDLSVLETFSPLVAGTPLVVARPEGAGDMEYLLDLIEREEVAQASFLPSQLSVLLEQDGLERLESLTGMMTGGETVPPSLPARFVERVGCALHNRYGPTETTLSVTTWEAQDERDVQTVPIGRRIAGADVVLLDADLRPVPLGMPGELVIGGVAVTRGYLDRPDLTAEQFVPDPRRPGERMYKSGDLARWRQDGVLEFLGRIDQQVKVRGFRIELGEIEAVLAEHPAVLEAAVIDCDEPGTDDRRLAAFVVLDPDAEPTGRQELLGFVGEKLPAYMVPAALDLMDEFPLSRSGKVDRRRLPEPTWATGRPGDTSPPVGPVEEQLAQLFRDVLDLETVGRHDDFFALGGHSLLAFRLISRVRTAFGIEIAMSRLFEEPTVAGLARNLGSRSAEAIPPRPDPAVAPLSLAQERLWFLAELEPDSPRYNMPGALAMDGELDLPAFAAALAGVAERHEPLRTRLVDDGDGPIQRILPPSEAPPELPLVDLTGLPPARRPGLARALARRQGLEAVPHDRAPLIRCLLTRISPTEHLLSVVLHHVIADGWSLGVLVRELAELYAARLEGRASTLDPLPLTYGDYALWQRQHVSEQLLAEQMDWWREELDGAPTTLELPTDRPRPQTPDPRGGLVVHRLPGDLVEALTARGQENGATLFMVLWAGFVALLGRLSGRTDLLVGTVDSGRAHAALEGLIGFFVDTLVLRGDLERDPSLTEVIRRARRAALGAFSHRELPFDRLVQEMGVDRASSAPPLVQVVLALQNVPRESLELPGLSLERMDLANDTVKFDLAVSFDPGGDGSQLTGVWGYSRALYDETTVERMTRQLETVYRAMAERPEQSLARLDLLAPSERHQLLVEWNDEPWPVDPDGACLHDVIWARSAATPDALAVVSDDGRLSYRQLRRRALAVAVELARRGVGPESRVGLCTERTLDQVVGALGIITAGAAYVPLDPAYPLQRLESIVEEAALDLVATHAPAESLVARLAVTPVWIDRLSAAPPEPEAALSELGRRPAATPDNALYVLFTSGSTGRPKGVVVCHRSVTNRLLWAALNDPVGQGPGLLKASIGFDLSVLETFSPLVAGTPLVLARPGGAGDMEYLLDLIEREGVAQTSFLPSQLSALLEQADLDRLAPLVGMMTGGEAVPPTLPERFAERVDCPLHNRYGPTETTLSVTTWEAQDERDVQTVPIGRRIGGADVVLYDARLRPVPIGVPGELVIGGVPVARGYLGRPALTAEQFVPDPRRPGARMYKSGDLVRWRQDGVLEFLGRIDQQVKVRGFRIELGEIEAVLVQHPSVLEAAVIDCDEPGTDNRRLAAFVVLDPKAAPEDREGLLAHVGDRLPAYMVPAALDLLDEFPLSAAGKVDRRRLPEPTWSTGEPAADAPESPLEHQLAEIFSAVLGDTAVGRHDDFFAAGGHSLLATRLVSRVRATFGIELALRTFFEAPTVAGLARVVEAALGAGESPDADAARTAPPLVPVAPDTPVRASFAQERLWFLARLDPGSAAYHMPGLVKIRGPVDRPALAAALGDVVVRHEALRTAFDETLDGVSLRVEEPAPLPLPVIDLAALPEGRRDEVGLQVARRVVARPFDLARGPLLRVSLVRLAPDEHLLALVMHHIVSDGWSVGLLIRELAAFYRARAEGTAPALDELAVQYRDFAAWQRGWLQGDVLRERMAWWLDSLAGAPAQSTLPHDRPRPTVQTFASATVETDLGAGSLAAVERLGQDLGVTPFMVVLAALGAVVGRLAGQDDLVIGSPSAGRNRPELEGLIGLFVNTLALRIDLAGNPSFEELLARVKDLTLEAQAREDLPFEQLVEAVAPGRDLATTPLFQVMLAYQNVPRQSLELPGAHLEGLAFRSTTAKFDLTLAVTERADRLAVQLEHNRDLFDTSTIERLGRQLSTFLAAAVERPETPVGRLPLLGPGERQVLLEEWATGAALRRRGETLHGLVTRQAAATPDAIAIADTPPAQDGARGESLTYAALAERAHAVATALVAAGVAPEERVGIYLGRSADAVVAILGVLAAGAAYVALDPKYPAERVAYMIEDSGCRFVLSDGELRGRLDIGDGDGDLQVLDVAALSEATGADASLPAVDPRQLAYLIYTSGSTGRPKGVAIPHASAVAMVSWALDTFPADAWGGVLAATSFCFDLSVYELFSPLAAGGRVVMVPDALALGELGPDDDVRLVNTVPSAMRQLLAANALPESVRIVNLAGEPLERHLADEIHRQAPDLEGLYNLYGPSEDTTYSTAFAVPAGRSEEPAIGRPIAGTRALVLDARGEPCPVGVPGELLLAGDGLARGYLGRPGRTAESFVPDPWGATPGERLYRTGDRVRWNPDGELDFLGRLDRQVKLRGYRIELGEIETVLGEHPAVAETAVIVHRGGAGDDLAAYVSPRDGAELDVTELRSFLGARLPTYMVPSYLVPLAELPHTPNGKVDRKALPAPQAGRSEARRSGEVASTPERVAPETELELMIAEFWAEVLETDVDQIGIHDDFFAHGGHSLKATQLLLRVREAFGADVPVRRFFQSPTLGGLSEAIAEVLLAAADDDDGDEVPAAGLETAATASLDGAARASFAQERLWFLARLDPGSAAYHMPATVRLRGVVERPTLAAALSDVVARHEVLRTGFQETYGGIFLQVHPPKPVQLPVIDLRALPSDRREPLALDLSERVWFQEFDLERGHVMHTGLIQVSADDHLLPVAMHHIASDGWSVALLSRELSAFYRARIEGVAPELPELPLQYGEFATWQRRRLQGETLEERLSWWRDSLADAPARSTLPPDKPRPAVQTFSSITVSTALPAGLVSAMKRLGAPRGVTPFVMLLAALGTVIGRRTGQEHVVIGSPSAGRTEPGHEHMIGLFVNTLALHVDLTGDPSFVGLLERVRELTLEARAREDVPFERLVDAVAPVRDLGTTPLFQIMLAFQNTPEESMEIQGTVLEVVHPRSTTAKFDITLFARETDGQLLLRFEYNRDLFERSTLEHLGVQIEALLAAAVTQPETPISRLPLPGLGEGFSPPSWQELETAAVAAPRRAEHVPPETELELVLAEFWSEVLEIDVDRVGIEDDFFEDGGHSLKATQLLLRVREAFGAQVPVRRFLERPTLAALAEAIAEVLLAEAEAQDAEDAEDAENAENAERA